MNGWMQTYSGKAFYPLAPSIHDIYPIDIGHALSMLCRYGGHTISFYSVAEHCVLMSRAVSPENALWALLHDASEAYLGDVIRPLKASMPTYILAEQHLMRVICQRFDISTMEPVEVSMADSRILLDERSTLLRPPPQPWTVEDLDPLGVTVEGWTPHRARNEYLVRLEELTKASI